jgi:hypothetical protein
MAAFLLIIILAGISTAANLAPPGKNLQSLTAHFLMSCSPLMVLRFMPE